MSIQNSLYNTIENATATNTSIMSYLNTYNQAMATKLSTKLTDALNALKACQNSGKAFAQDPGAACVKTAMDAIGELDEALNEASAWILAN